MENVRITDIKLMALSPYQNDVGLWNLIRVECDQGVWGLGEAYWGPGFRPAIDALLKPLFVGENPFDIDRLFTRATMQMAGAHTQNGLVMSALSGIEIALWDLAGKLSGLPAYRLLGGRFRERVRLYRTGLPPHLEEYSACEEYAAKTREEGWTAIKTLDVDTMHQRYDPQFREPGHEPLARTLSAADLKRSEKIMANLRRAFGDEFDIAVHCHWALDLRDALALAEVIAPYRPLWLEDPLPVAFSPAWVELKKRSPVPICTGENLYNRHEFRPFIAEGGTDIAHIDVPKSGGLLEAKRIADLADLHYIKTAMHCASSIVGLTASAQAAASMRSFSMLERAGGDFAWYEKLVDHDEPLIQDGHLVLPKEPGLGLRLNPDIVKEHLAPGEQYWGDA
jgi:L-alanine-DL-glutamate epimerase-like enolase superfamily enzyme